MYKKNNNVAAQVICSILIILLLATIAIAIPSKGFTDWDKFKKKVEEPVENPDDVKPDGGDSQTESSNVVITQSEANGIYLSLASAASDGTALDSKIITATVDTAVDENKVVDWQVFWNDETSEWATGKNIADYVTVVPDSDGALRATINCFAPFGERILVVCTSRINSALSATCEIDYAKRVIDFNYVVNSNGESVSVIDFTDDEPLYSLGECSVVYGVGTLETGSDASFSWKLNDGFVNYLKENFNPALPSGMNFYQSIDINANYGMPVNGIHGIKFYFSHSGTDFVNATSRQYGFYTVNFSKSFSMATSSRYYTAFNNALINAMKKALDTYSGNVIDITCTYSDAYSNYTETKSVAKGVCSYSALTVSSVSLSQGSIIF